MRAVPMHTCLHIQSSDVKYAYIANKIHKNTRIFQNNKIRKKYVKIRLFTTGQDSYTVYKLSKRCKLQHTIVY